MAITDHMSEITVSYPAENVYTSMFGDEFSQSGFIITLVEDNLRTLHLKTKMSLVSFGEKITISVQEIDQNKSRIIINSHPLAGIMFGGLFDFGKNRKNIRKIMEIIDENLDHCVPNQTPSIETTKNHLDEADQILKFHELKKAGIISQEEFEKKKRKLLND